MLASSIVFAAAAISFAALRNDAVGLIQVTGKGTISVSVADLRPGQARFYIYTSDDGANVRFIVARDETGRVEAAVDACEECAAYGQGYTSSKGYVICRYCGNRYRMSSLATGAGSCVPWKLNYVIRGDEVQISSAELTKWRRMF
ncbi:MAG TPA: Fe-S-containing protein [Candidatus Binataceae bacterium]|nr:Fe-S-containing protein [Candidatus Binataceae bacterium]